MNFHYLKMEIENFYIFVFTFTVYLTVFIHCCQIEKIKSDIRNIKDNLNEKYIIN